MDLESSVDAKIKNAKRLWALPSVIIVLITVQSLLQLFRVRLATVPLIGGLSRFIHSNLLISEAANVFFYQDTAAIAFTFLVFTLCWILQYIYTFKYGHREFAFGSSVIGSLFFIVLFFTLYTPLFLLQGFVMEKLLFFGIAFGVVASLVDSYRTFPWKELIISEISDVLSETEIIIRNTEKEVKEEFRRVGDRRVAHIDETAIYGGIIDEKHDIENSCRGLLSELNEKKKEVGNEKNISDLNLLLPVTRDLLKRAEKNRDRLDEFKKSIRYTFVRVVDKMFTDVTSLASKMNCTFELDNLPDDLREINIPELGGAKSINKVSETLKLMIKDESREIKDFEGIFNRVGGHLDRIKRYIEEEAKALNFNEVERMIKNAEESVTNIPNEMIRKKFELLYSISSGSKYNKLRLAKDKLNEAKEHTCDLLFVDARHKLEDAKELVKGEIVQLEFVRAMIGAVEDKWDSMRIPKTNLDILEDLKEEFLEAYGATYTIKGKKLKIDYKPVTAKREIKTGKIRESYPNEVRNILYLFREKIEDKKEPVAYLSEGDLPVKTKRPEVLKEFRNFIHEILGEGVSIKYNIPSISNFIEIRFEENLDPVESINIIISEHEKRW